MDLKTRGTDGRYSYQGRWNRRCTCGHTLGHHTAAAPHSCIEADYGDAAHCECIKFRKAAR